MPQDIGKRRGIASRAKNIIRIPAANETIIVPVGEIGTFVELAESIRKRHERRALESVQAVAA